MSAPAGTSSGLRRGPPGLPVTREAMGVVLHVGVIQSRPSQKRYPWVGRVGWIGEKSGFKYDMRVVFEIKSLACCALQISESFS